MPLPSVIAIDGPVASGKTAVGRLVARRLGFRFLDTGAMYRAVSALALRRGIHPDDEEGLSRLARQVRLLVSQRDGHDQVLADGEDLTAELRRPEVEQVVSLVSRVGGVREALVEQQREIARGGGIVMAGRDIGTVVLPHAPLKVFLWASPEERARRRWRELRAQGREASYEEVLAGVHLRDQIDTHRAHSPLRPAPDAHYLDTDHLTLEQVVERVLALAEDD